MKIYAVCVDDSDGNTSNPLKCFASQQVAEANAEARNEARGPFAKKFGWPMYWVMELEVDETS